MALPFAEKWMSGCPGSLVVLVRVVKFIKQLADGNVSKIKKSTLFPETWSDTQVIDAVQHVADSPALMSQVSNQATVHRGVVNRVGIEVLRAAMM